MATALSQSNLEPSASVDAGSSMGSPSLDVGIRTQVDGAQAPDAERNTRGYKRLPVFLDLVEKRVLVVGAGLVAHEKLLKLVDTGARLTVIAQIFHPEVTALLEQASREGLQVETHQREVGTEDLAGFDLIYLATNDSDLNRTLRNQARQLGTLTNAVDDPPNCDFFSTAVVERGPLRIAISSDGTFPSLVASLRRFMETTLPDVHLEELAKIMDLRARLRAMIEDPCERMTVLKSIRTSLEHHYFRVHSSQSH